MVGVAGRGLVGHDCGLRRDGRPVNMSQWQFWAVQLCACGGGFVGAQFGYWLVGR